MGIAILSIIALIVVFVSFVPGRTSYIPTAEYLENYYQELVSYYSEILNDDEAPEESADTEFSKQLFKAYTEATTHNMKMNKRRFKIMASGNTFLFSTIVGTLLALSCYVPTFFEDDANVQKVEVVKPKIADEKKE